MDNLFDTAIDEAEKYEYLNPEFSVDRPQKPAQTPDARTLSTVYWPLQNSRPCRRCCQLGHNPVYFPAPKPIYSEPPPIVYEQAAQRAKLKKRKRKLSKNADIENEDASSEPEDF